MASPRHASASVSVGASVGERRSRTLLPTLPSLGENQLRSGDVVSTAFPALRRYRRCFAYTRSLDGKDPLAVRADRRSWLVVLPLTTLLRLLGRVQG